MLYLHKHAAQSSDAATPGANAMPFSKVCRLVSESTRALLSRRGVSGLQLALAAQTSHSTGIRIGIDMGKRGTR